jgi:hypothetical protein
MIGRGSSLKLCNPRSALVLRPLLSPLFTGVRGKWNTRNSIFRILHITSSQSHKELAPRRIRAWCGISNNLWCSIDMRGRECSSATLETGIGARISPAWLCTHRQETSTKGPILKTGWVTPTYARVSTTGLRSIEVDGYREGHSQDSSHKVRSTLHVREGGDR